MPKRIKTADAQAAMRKILETQAKDAAGSNTLISKTEARGLGPVLHEAQADVREAEGEGSRVTVDEAVDQAMHNAAEVWDRFNPPGTVDGRFLAKAEVREIKKADPALGELAELAYVRAGKAGGGDEVKAAVKAFFDNFDFSADDVVARFPNAVRVDARPGEPGRADLPESVLAGFDLYYRAEFQDWASASAHRATIDGHEVHVLWTSTDGDDAYLEVYDETGAPLASATILGGEMLGGGWDPFFGRSRLTETWTAFDGPRMDEGYSEVHEQLAAGQITNDWVPEVSIDEGSLTFDGPSFIRLMTAQMLTPQQRELAYAGYEIVFDRVLTHRVWNNELDLSRNGALRIGTHTRSDDGETYMVVDWKDIDDGSYTLYFQKDDDGVLDLKISQYNN